ncbi:2,5-diketo-D-gluconate reductase B [Chromobacterium alkanivorans]|uniref:2,5-didehydrogluconate reductase DkgB n=1 Tax=Chromobacterium alkanivorans TaxID=1071719 RepID=UPI002168BE08|nr:2,5-didehydrogluconate reductase DkgB [Chromobacterium alkanivorans]MCS3804561.1 2,5-diketo-D-gluconate reductase B [Chromobacterium alkanivorans]MCS3818900.1 2,5-diketo-D-gluconate reductase B [Chromobacterium alkanivorans]MCS3873242.1 2,5-diketo-D-gluconate reductase B [Chromobacterium alkanivorans]
MDMPKIGLGTFRLEGQQVVDSVLTGLELGYRHIDTAQIYGNEAEVGLALRRSGLPREQVFVTTKIWTENLGRERLADSLRRSLELLGVEQVDMTLIHWPSPGDALPVAEYMEALAEARQQGLTRRIGVSNFTIAHLRQALAALGPGEIASQQVEAHPFLQNRKLLDFCREQEVPVTAYMPLAYGKVMAEPLLQRIAARHQASPAQVALAWLLRRGLSVIPSSTRRANLAANLEAEALSLSEADMDAIAGLERGERLANPELSPRWD